MQKEDLAQEQKERFDVYTADGVRTGRTMEKGVDCTGDDYYIGVHMFVYNSQYQFLLQRRALEKDFLAGEWEVCMGHVMAGETPVEAARRELTEELGVSFENATFTHVARFVWRRWNHIMDAFFVRADLDLQDLHLQKEEVMDAKWVSKEEMAQFLRTIEYRPPFYGDALLRYLNDTFQ